MLYAYIDESYIKDDIYLVAALVVNRHQQDAIQFGLEDVIRSTNASHPHIPLDIEFHGQQLFQRDGVWACVREQPKVAYGIYRRAVGKVAPARPALFIGGVRRADRLRGRYKNPWPPHQIALQYTLEMVNDFAAQRGSRVKVVADRVENQEIYEAAIRLFQQRGRTPGWNPSDLATIEPEFEWVDSREHRPLQVADLYAYIYLRHRYKDNPHPRAAHEAKRIFDLMQPIIHKVNIWTP